MVKKNGKEYFKSRGFYITLAFGVVAVLGIGALGLQMNSKNQNNGLTDLNEPIAMNDPNYNVAENMDSAKEETNNQQQTADNTQTENEQIMSNENTLEGNQAAENQSIASENDTDVADNTKTADVPIDLTGDAEENVLAENVPDTTTDVADQTEEEESVSVLNPKSTIDGLSFREDTGLLWPISGDIIMKYSDNKGIYFQTLGQYKCNPAIMIQGDVGTQVLTAAKCTITDISEDEETGLTVTTSIGNDYEVIYGQMKDINVEVGDTLEEGQVLGCLADPTKYYVLEGSNLYFKVLQDGKAINPMLLLR